MITKDEQGTPNAAPFSFFNFFSGFPPVVCVGIGRRDGRPKDSLANVERSGEFVINLVNEELAQAMNVTATPFPPGVNELEMAGLEVMPSNLVDLPRIAASPVALECRLHQLVDVDTTAKIVIAHVVAMPKPDLDAIVNTIERERITTTILVPTVIYSLLARPDIRSRDFSSLRYLCVGAAPLSKDKLSEALNIFGPVIAQIYGQTEASSMLTCMTPQDYGQIMEQPAYGHRLTSCGRPSPFARIAIMNSDGELLPTGERGEVVVRSGMVMQGYLDDPVGQAEASRHGWHHTGDVGYLDEDGFLYIVDRLRDLIISGGFNVFPIDIEQVIWGHPGVQDCAVVGVPDDKWGEAVKAVVQLKPGAQVTEDDIIDLCRRQLGAVKTPKSVEFWEALPKSPLGKVLKKDIRAKFW